MSHSFLCRQSACRSHLPYHSCCLPVLVWECLLGEPLYCLFTTFLIPPRAVHNASGPGTMFREPATAGNTGWAFMFGITAILGAWGAGTLGQSDWTRYASRRYAPTLSQLVAAPITISVTATIGIIVTSAARDILGGAILWNPIYLLAELQEHYHSSPRSRAGAFFASLGLVSSQLAVCSFQRSYNPNSLG